MVDIPLNFYNVASLTNIVQKKQKNIIIVVFAVVMLLCIGIVGIVSFSDSSFFKTSTVEELTFDCDAGADLKSEEKCKCRDNYPDSGQSWCHRHTYLLDSPKKVSSIWGTIEIWGSSHHTLKPTVYMDFLIRGVWSEKRSWIMDASAGFYDGKINSFSVNFAPVTIDGFRFCTGTFGSRNSPYIWGSAGTILVESPSPTTYCLTVHTTPSHCHVSLGGDVIESDNSGFAIFDDVEAGKYEIIISKVGYVAIYDEVIVYNDKSVSYVLDQVSPEKNTILYYTNPENIGSIVLNGQTYTNGQTSEETGGTYSIYAENGSGYEFERWSATGGLTLHDEDLQNTFVSISGGGSIKAWYRDVNEPLTPGFNICALLGIILIILVGVTCVFLILRKKKHT